MNSNVTITEKQVTIDAALFEEMYFYFSAMRMMPEIWRWMSQEKHEEIWNHITPIYDKLNP